MGSNHLVITNFSLYFVCCCKKDIFLNNLILENGLEACQLL